ncbi:MAG: hypothetical protein HYY17_00635 [Planctomycetes bacterium]|nr:hypothetical protein [Planctomycetota bacterium]
MIERELGEFRRGIRRARAVERAVRWTFYALLLAILGLAGTKLLGLALPAPLLLLVPAVPLAAALREAGRAFSLRDCAVLVDRDLKLEERIATAVEGGGSFAGALEADARKALGHVDARSVGRVRWPRETPFLAIAGLVVLLLLAIPAPEGTGRSNPALQGTAREESRKILAAARAAEESPDPGTRAMAGELREIAALLDRGTPEAAREALARLRALEERAASRMLAPGLTEAEAAALREIADRAAGSGAALSRVLDSGAPPDGKGNPPPPGVVKKMERPGQGGGVHASDRPSSQVAKELGSSDPARVDAREAVARRLSRRDWPARGDAAVRRYFSE